MSSPSSRRSRSRSTATPSAPSRTPATTRSSSTASRHAWSGEGGLLDKQGQLENSGKYRNSFATWREITPEHNKLVEQMLGSSAHVIATMRTKTEYVVEKDDRGKNTVRKLGLSPVQRDGVEYEFTVVLDVAENHTARASKDRTTLFDGWCDRISAATGRTLRQWLDSGTEPPVRAVAASMAPAPVVRGDEWPDDVIPELDDFDAPPSAESAPRNMRDEINEAVPMKASATAGLPDLELPDPEEHTHTARSTPAADGRPGRPKSARPWTTPAAGPRSRR